jgi:hydrogenase maturation protease
MKRGTVIIGLGNRLLSDDGVGMAVANQVAELVMSDNLTVIELNTGGIRLMEAMAGHCRAIVVDAMQSGAEPGTVRRFDPESFVTTKNTCSSHDTDFGTAFRTGQMLGVPLPELVSFWGVEVLECAVFSEELSAAVAAAVPLAAELIVNELKALEAAR